MADVGKMCIRATEPGLPCRLNGKQSACQGAGTSSTPGAGRSPGGGNGNHSRSLAWEIPWTEEPGGLWFMETQESWTGLGD